MISEIENTVIAGLIFDFDNYKTVLEELTPSEFENVLPTEIFSLMKDYVKTNSKIDEGFIQPLNEDLKQYVFDLQSIITGGMSVKYYVQEIRHNAQQRRIHNAISKITLESRDKLSDLERLVETEKKNAVGNYTEDRQKQFADVMNYLFTPEKEDERIYTGFSVLDRTLSGLRRGSISVIGARASAGKTAFAIDILREQVKRKVKTLFFSLEMSRNQIWERYLSSKLFLNYTKIGKKEYEENEKREITAELTRIYKENNIYIFDDIYTVEGIIRTIASLKPQLAIIDFIQIMRTVESFRTNKERIDYMCGEIKRCARIYNCHILTLSQISRDGKDRPTMSDLKESGALEENNDYVMILHRPFVQDKAKHKPEEAELLLDKNKYGNTGRIELHFNGEKQRFTEVTSRNEK